MTARPINLWRCRNAGLTAILPTAQSVNVTGLVAQDKLLATLAYFVIDPDKESSTRCRDRGDRLNPDRGWPESRSRTRSPYSEAGAIALQPDGRIVLAGRAQRSNRLVDLGAVVFFNGSGVRRHDFRDGFDP